jgi:hypothetical protein
MSTPQPNDARIVRVSSTQRATLRRQTWEILDLEHHRFEAFAEQRATATLFRDALALLDALGHDTSALDLTLTARHITHLEARRTDLTQAIADHPDDEHHTLTDRAALADLSAIIAAYTRSAR